MRRFDGSLIPPGINDGRIRWLWGSFDAALAEVQLTPATLCMRTSAEMSAEMLPLAVWELSLEEFVPEEGLPEHVVRRLIGRAVELHALKGTDEGVQLGMQVLLGGTAEIVHWWQKTPRGHHDTHTITVWVGEAWDGGVLTPLQQIAARRMIDATKRWSQDTDFRIGTLHLTHSGTAAVQRTVDCERRLVAASVPPMAEHLGSAAISRQIEMERQAVAAEVPASTVHLGVAAVLRGIEVDRRTIQTEVM